MFLFSFPTWVKSRARVSRKVFQKRLRFELLEDRKLLATVTPHFLLFQPVSSNGTVTPAASSSPTGLTPSVIRQAYGVDITKFGSIVGDGTGQTIAIVDAYDLPTAASDLIAFDRQFGLPDPPSFTKINQFGGTTLPKADVKGGWGVETALDIEWAHAIAPKASILLVEANSASDADMYAAVDTARNYPGVSVVSMSWGSDEVSSDSANNNHFLTPAGHTGVSFLASSGDNGAYSPNTTTKAVSYPAVAPNVVGVGGTYLTTNNGVYVSETGWGSGTTSGVNGGAGGGISKFIAQPNYQKGVVTQSTTFRTVPDISMNADPRSGTAVYDSYDLGASTPWISVGGTSLAAPMLAGVVAIVDQGRSLNGLSNLDGVSELLPAIYSITTADLHDITSGNNGFATSAGYDLVTGRGTPIVNKFAVDLSGTPVSTLPTIAGLMANPTTVLVGNTVALSATGVVVNNGTIASVAFYRESNGASGLQEAADTLVGNGVASGTTWSIKNVSTAGLALGNYTYYAIATDAAGQKSNVASVVVTVTDFIPPTPVEIVGWNVAGQSLFGKQGLKATTVASGITNTQGLTRGTGLGTSGSAVSNAWGATSFSNSSAAAISSGDTISFGFTVALGSKASLNSIDLSYRHSESGPKSGLWQYAINTGAWVTIANIANEFPSTTGAIPTIPLSNVSALQNLTGGTKVSIRLVPYGATNSSGTWYVSDQTGDDFYIMGTTAVVPAFRSSVSVGPSNQLPTLGLIQKETQETNLSDYVAQIDQWFISQSEAPVLTKNEVPSSKETRIDWKPIHSDDECDQGNDELTLTSDLPKSTSWR